MVANKFELPPLPQLKELSVVVTTIEQSGDLAYYPGLEPGHFTHIFIDEAAQVSILGTFKHTHVCSIAVVVV